MRIAQVSPLYERVPPVMYGGTERVVSYLTEELVRLGHEVTLFASGDSVTRARLRPACESSLRLDERYVDPLSHHLRMLGEVYEQAQAFDIIHTHTDYLGLPLSRFVDTPTVVTLHGRLDIPDLAPLYAHYKDVPLISISDAQRRPLPDANWAATVYHGLPPELYHYSADPGDYLLFLGRISHEKRPDTAIRVALEAGMPLRIAAKVDAVDRAYFAEVVQPLRNDPLIDFIGEVDEKQKRELLGGARALLFPIDWPEPFGLVMIEALACGTPVIARPCGSVGEVLRDGETAWLCDSEEEMIEAVQQLDKLDRARCRAEFDERYTVTVMARHYVDTYASIVAARRAQRGRAQRPRARPADGNGHGVEPSVSVA
jgi:glycosyltransferase involved in cell wall biosynthesis